MGTVWNSIEELLKRWLYESVIASSHTLFLKHNGSNSAAGLHFLSSMARNAAQQSQPKGIRCAFAACRNISDVRVSNRHIFVQRYFVHAAIQPTLLFSAGAALP
uniref:Uncharacterized protein n=1 Tax=Trichuris muris TaxID=70415 RepID=A0A5S6Q6V8_TRIMR